MKFGIHLGQDEDGRFVATCPALPGCISQRKTREEARVNISDAIGGYLASLRKHDEPIPPAITEEVIEVDLRAQDMNDPIVEEVRRIRDAHAARFNYDLDAIFQDIKEQERKRNRKFTSLTREGIAPEKATPPSGLTE
jgi:predicted RNase H-like HicB family nuclease